MSFADKAENINVQNHFFDAQRQITSKTADMHAEFHSALRNVMDAASRLESKPQILPGQEELTLLNKDIYEKNLALQTLTDHAERHNFQQLYALSQRLAVVTNAPALEFEDLPASPQSITHAFTQSIKNLSIENDAQLVLYALYDKFILSKLTEIYDSLNSQLVDANILPLLKYKLKKSADTLGSAPDTQHPTIESPESPESPTSKETAATLEGETMSRICSLLAASRNATTAPRTPLPKGVHRASNAEVAQAFTTAETAPSTALPRDFIYGNGEETVQVNKALLKRVRSALVEQRESVKGAIGHDRLNDIQEDVIDVVGMLFENMLDDPTVPGLAKALLGHLHTPYIKYALKNSELLSNKSHPARIFFNLAVDGASVWVEELNLNAGIYPLLKDVVGDLVRQKELSNQNFDHYQQQLSEKIAKLEKKSSTTENRSTEAEKGRAKLEHTKDLAHKTTDQIFGGQEITLECKRFIDSVWIDYLILILLRDRGNTTWKKAESLGKQILLLDQHAATTQANKDDIEALSIRIMEEIGALLPHKSTLIDRFLESLQRKGAATIAMQNSESNERNTEIDDTLQPICEKLQVLPTNSWLEFRPHGAKRYKAKLSWYNPHSGNFLFVGSNGQKVALKEMSQLAKEINEGIAFILPHHEHSFFDRALNSIKSALESTLATRTEKQQAG